MDLLTFISTTIGHIAWPVSVVAIVYCFRTPLLELVPLMKKIKYKELEMEFSQELKVIKEETSAYKEKKEKTKIYELQTEKILGLLEYSTRAALMEAWVELETAAVEVASSFWVGDNRGSFRNLRSLGEYLYQCNVIDKTQLDVFNRLRDLRNKAAHAEELTLSESSALDYIESTMVLVVHFKKYNKSSNLTGEKDLPSS